MGTARGRERHRDGAEGPTRGLRIRSTLDDLARIPPVVRILLLRDAGPTSTLHHHSRQPDGDVVADALVPVVVAGRLTDHRATADVASEPEDQQNNQHKTEQSAAVVWGAPPGTTAVIGATASTPKQHDQDDDREDRHSCTAPVSFPVHGYRSSRGAYRIHHTAIMTSVCAFENTPRRCRSPSVLSPGLRSVLLPRVYARMLWSL